MENEEHDCPACGGNAVPMGTLGNTLHLRCRDCGIDSSAEAPQSKTIIRLRLPKAAAEKLMSPKAIADLQALGFPVESISLVKPEEKEDDAGFPWCEACKSWHHPDNPTCFLKS